MGSMGSHGLETLSRGPTLEPALGLGPEARLNTCCFICRQEDGNHRQVVPRFFSDTHKIHISQPPESGNLLELSKNVHDSIVIN